MKISFSAFLFLLFSCRLVSQTETTMSMLTVNDGLSQGMIFDLMQSRDGFIWIATKDGLNRYGGARFKIFSPDPFNPYAIGGSEVQSLFEDSQGWIWIKHPWRLDVFNPTDGRFFLGTGGSVRSDSCILPGGKICWCIPALGCFGSTPTRSNSSRKCRLSTTSTGW